MPRHIVCLTFDFDAVSSWIARGLTTPTPISRGEFGVVGAARILDLLKKHGIRTTWFIPGHTIETYPDMCKRVVDDGHEIGHHGWTHVPPAKFTRAEEEAQLVRANRAIENLCGRKARGYRSPAWDLSGHTIDLLVEHGFFYESSLMGHDYLPYYARRGDVVELLEPMVFGEETSLVEMPISWTLDDFPHFEYIRLDSTIMAGLKSAKAVLGNWFDDFVYMRKNLEWGVVTYTFHPMVIGRGHRMLALEDLIDKLIAGGATFLPMETAAREFVERRS